jgi:hypothetical protein
MTSFANAPFVSFGQGSVKCAGLHALWRMPSISIFCKRKGVMGCLPGAQVVVVGTRRKILQVGQGITGSLVVSHVLMPSILCFHIVVFNCSQTLHSSIIARNVPGWTAARRGKSFVYDDPTD